ncbi:MAG: hypothetical protein SVW77_02150 [Candidatus Nanohaloarchaea archaeon]|nr:hypothetical protein [Candidatus Nanohaloarchaea archaeon]
METPESNLVDDVKSYLEAWGGENPLGWYVYKELRTRYAAEDMEGRPAVELGTRNDYPDTDTVYDIFSPGVRALPTKPRMTVRKPRMGAFAAAYNQFVDNPSAEETARRYAEECGRQGYQELAPVYEFLDGLPAGVSHEEDILDRVEGEDPRVARNVADLVHEFSGQFDTPAELAEIFEEQLWDHHFWFAVVHEMEVTDSSISDIIQDDIHAEVDEEFYRVGTSQKSVYVDRDQVYVLDYGDEGDEKRFTQVPDERAAISLEELVGMYAAMAGEDGDIGAARDLLQVMRELYHLGEAEGDNVELFYDTRRETMYIYDRDTIDFHEAGENDEWLERTVPDLQRMADEVTEGGVRQGELFDRFLEMDADD